MTDRPRLELFVPALPLSRIVRGKFVREPWVGFYVSDIFRQSRARKARWESWRAWVRFHAQTQIGRRWEPVPSAGWSVTTQAVFPHRRHGDVENVHKGLVDILVGRRRHSPRGTFLFLEDRDLAGDFGAPQYDRARPGVHVTIEEVHP